MRGGRCAAPTPKLSSALAAVGEWGRALGQHARAAASRPPPTATDRDADSHPKPVRLGGDPPPRLGRSADESATGAAVAALLVRLLAGVLAAAATHIFLGILDPTRD